MTSARTLRLIRDATWRRFGDVVVAGSPLRLFRLTAAGAEVADRIEADQEVSRSTLVDRLLDAGAVHPCVDHAGLDHAGADLAGDEALDRVDDTLARRPDGSDGGPRFGLDDVTVVTPHLGGLASTDGRIIVDDGSTPPVRGATIRLETNRGPAAARNAARPLVDTPLVAFVDADVDLLDQLGGGSWLSPLMAHFDDPRVGLVAPRVCGEATSQLDLGDAPGRVRAGTRIGYVPGAAIVMRVDAFDAVGGFDETLRVGEDVDLVWRLDDAGWICRYEPTSRVWHEPRRSMRARLRQHRVYGTSAAPLALRHPRSLAPFRANIWTVGALLLGMVGRPIAAVGVGFGSAAALPSKLPGVPAMVAVRMAVDGHVGAVRQAAAAIRRVWWPIVALAAVASRRARIALVCSALVDLAATPVDLAYGAGVWQSVIRHRTVRPLLPDVTRKSTMR